MTATVLMIAKPFTGEQFAASIHNARHTVLARVADT